MQYLVIIPEEHGKLQDAVKELSLGLGVPHSNFSKTARGEETVAQWRERLFAQVTKGFSGFYVQAKTSVRSAEDDLAGYFPEFHHIFVMDYHPTEDDRSSLVVLKSRNLKLRKGDSFTLDTTSPRSFVLSLLTE